MAKEIVTIELDDNVLKAKLNEINKQLNENNKAIAKNKAEISSLTKETKDLDKAFKQGAITAEEYADEIERNATATARLQEENRGLSTENKKLSTDFRNLTAIQEQQVGSLNRLRAELRDAQKQFDALSREQRDNAEIGGALQKRIEALNTEVSKAEQATGRYQRQVGNYAGVGRTFAEALQAQGGALGNVITGVQGFNTALKANPLMAVLTVLLPLIASFKQLQPVLDLIGEAMGAVNAVMDVLIARATKVFDAFVAIINLDFAKAADDISASVSGLGTALADAASAGLEFAKVQKAIDDENDRIALSTAKADTEINKLIRKLSDRTLSEQERLKIAEDITKIEEANLNAQLKNANAQLKLDEDRLRLALSAKGANLELLQTTEALVQAAKDYQIQDEIFQNVTKAAVELQKVEQASLALTEKVQVRRNAILEEEKQAKEKAAAETKAKLEKLKQERLKYEQDIANLTNEFILSEAEKIKAQFAEKLALVKGEGEKEKALRIAIKKAENDALLALEADRLAKEQKLKEEAFQKNTALFNQVLDAEVLKVKQSFLNKEISEQQYNDALDKLNLERLESEKVALELAGKSTIEIDNKITEAKIANQKKLEERTQQSSDKIKQIATIERDARIQLAQSVFSFISGLGVKSKALQRSLALASIIASQAQAIGTAVANAQQSALGTGPLAVFTAPGFTATLIGTVLSGIGQAIGTLKQIDSVQTPGFATGGLVKGGIPIKRSNGDNVLATLKTGEVVLNKGQQNALGGAGVFRAIGVPGFATGGVVGNTSAIDNNNSLVSQFTDALQDIQIFTAVTDINTGQSNFAKVVERAQV